MILVVLRPEFASSLDITGSKDVKVSAVRGTETSGGNQQSTKGLSGPNGTAGPTPNPKSPARGLATPEVSSTLTFTVVKLKADCRLRQEPGYHAIIIQNFAKGTTFKVYPEQRKVLDAQTGVETTWQKVGPEDNTNREGWII